MTLPRILPVALASLAVLLALAPGPAPAAPPPEPPPEPVLATPPTARLLVPAEFPDGVVFPAPEVLVVLSIDVAATGLVEAVRVEEGAGQPFDEAAATAARKFIFEPGRLSTGEAVPVTIAFRMRLTPPPPVPAPDRAPAPVRLAGRLLERGTRKPLASVAVAARTAAGSLKATTGPDGRFLLVVPEPEFTLVAVPPGHDRLELRVEAKAGEERDETFYLERSGDGNETVVSASPIRREITRQVIPASDVAKVAGTQGDTVKAVLNMPGVARTAFGLGQLILRGSSPNDTRVFVEGQEIPLLYHFGGLRSTINPRFLQQVDFIPGNFAPDYGRANGGIVEVKLRDPASDLVRGEAGVNLYDASVAIEGPLGAGWSGGAAFRRSWIDTILPLVLPREANLSFDSAPRYYDYQFLASKKLGDQSLRLLYYGSLDKLVVILEKPPDDPKITGTISARTMFHAIQASLSGPVAPGLSHQSSLQLSFNQFRTQFGPEFFFDLSVPQLAVRSAWTLDLTRGLQLRAGIDATAAHITINLNTPSAPKEGEPGTPVSTSSTISLERKLGQQEPAAFLELRWEPLPSVLVLPGVRVDWYSAISGGSVDPRLGARWEVKPGTALKAAIGLFHQPPQPDESAPEVGNPDLKPEAALQSSVGVEHQVSDTFAAEATVFNKRLTDLVVRNPAAAYDPSLPPYTNQGTGRVYGLELVLKARAGERFFGWIAYTFQRSYRTDLPGQPERPFSYDQPHNLTLVGTWNFARAWSFGGRFRYVSGNPSTPVTGSVLDAGSGAYVPLYGAINSTRLPAFNQLDLRLDRTWTYRTWKLVGFLDVQNVTNRGNVEGYSYSYDYRQKTPATGLPILPILGVNAEW
jgi:TonB family protein